jgi:DnaJ-class molecular chaperone
MAMAPKTNHYRTLGVPRDAPYDSIRKAFRKRAKECHPDCSGQDGEQFKALNEAHEVLSDPSRRRSYDRELSLREARTTEGPSERPARPDRSWSFEPRTRRPWSPGELIRDAGGAGHASWAPQWAAERAFDVELVLSHTEQLFGARVPLALTLPGPCPRCELASGPTGRCFECGGVGRVAERVVFDVLVPPGIRDGRVIAVRLVPPFVDAPVLVRMTVRVELFF